MSKKKRELKIAPPMAPEGEGLSSGIMWSIEALISSTSSSVSTPSITMYLAAGGQRISLPLRHHLDLASLAPLPHPPPAARLDKREGR